MKVGDLVWSCRCANADLGIVASDTYIIKDARGQENEYVDILFQENGLQQELADYCSTDLEYMISYFREREEIKSALQKKYKEFKNESR